MKTLEEIDTEIKLLKEERKQVMEASKSDHEKYVREQKYFHNHGYVAYAVLPTCCYEVMVDGEDILLSQTDTDDLPWELRSFDNMTSAGVHEISKDHFERKISRIHEVIKEHIL